MMKIKRLLENPYRLFSVLATKKLFDWMPDKLFLQLMFRARFGKKLDLVNPKSFSEKIQWLKLYDRDEKHTIMVDKYLVRDYVTNMIGEEYLIPLLGVWENPDDINFEVLPEQFVLKCNHNSGKGMYICKDRTKMNRSKVIRGLKDGLREDYYRATREWPYKNVKKKVIAEKYMVDESGIELKDYKVLCFNGKPAYIELHQGRFTNHQTQVFYDTKWNKLSISQSNVSEFQKSNKIVPKPVVLEEMLRLSAILSEGLALVRVDWYCVNEKLYFGELTFFDGSGWDPFDDPADDLILGNQIDLSIVNSR